MILSYYLYIYSFKYLLLKSVYGWMDGWMDVRVYDRPKN